MGFYEGGDIDSITTENVILVVPTLDATFITFRVHGSERIRTYRFSRHITEILRSLPELAEFL